MKVLEGLLAAPPESVAAFAHRLASAGLREDFWLLTSRRERSPRERRPAAAARCRGDW